MRTENQKSELLKKRKFINKNNQNGMHKTR